MKIVCISDTHSMHGRVFMPPGDVLIHAGDATAIGKPEECLAFINWFHAQPYRYKLFVPGNHDFGFDRDGWLRNLVHDPKRGAHLLIDREIEINGLHFYGSPWVPNLEGWAFYGDELLLTLKFAKIPDRTNVLITHGPPEGLMDDCGSHVGSRELKRRLEQLWPIGNLKLHVFGHIHEGYGRQNGSVNAAICTREYKPTNLPIVVELPKIPQQLNQRSSRNE